MPFSRLDHGVEFLAELLGGDVHALLDLVEPLVQRRVDGRQAAHERRARQGKLLEPGAELSRASQWFVCFLNTQSGKTLSILSLIYLRISSTRFQYQHQNNNGCLPPRA